MGNWNLPRLRYVQPQAYWKVQSGGEEDDIGDGHEWEAAGGYEDADAELLINLEEAGQGRHAVLCLCHSCFPETRLSHPAG